MKQGSVTRRRSLQVAAAGGAVAFTGCQVQLPQTPLREFVEQSRVRLAEDTVTAYEDWYASVCRQCDAGCGIIVRVIEGRAKKVEGNPDHPLNLGKLCARGQAAVQEQYHPDRLRGPQRLAGGAALRGRGKFSPTTWEEALGNLGSRLQSLFQAGRGGQVAMITPPLSGHQAAIVDRFTHALGAQWLVFESLPEAPLREAVRRLFGQDRLPVFDIENARYILSFGADFLGTWLSSVRYGVEYGVFRQGSYRLRDFAPRQSRPRGYLVQVEPRFSATAANADEWVPVAPGREGMLALSIAQVMLSEGLADPAGAAAFGDRRALDAFTPERVAPEAGQANGVTPDRIRQLARAFASQRPSLAIGGGPAGAFTNGTETVTAILALNALSGGINVQGGVLAGPPLTVTGLPAPARASSLGEWQQFVQRLNGGLVDTVLVYGADPAHGLPAGIGLRDALLRAPFIASFSSFFDDTAAVADLLLPAHLPLEDWGDGMPEPGSGVATVTVQQPVTQPFYDTQSFGDTLLALAGEIGGLVQDALPWATLKAAVQDGARALWQLNQGSVQEPNFERFWTRLLQQGGWWDTSSQFTVHSSQSSTPLASSAGTIAVNSAALQQAIGRIGPPRFAGGDPEFPYYLTVFPHNTLGTGETAHLPWLQAAPDPVTSVVWQTWVEVNPSRARALGFKEGDVVRVESPQGQVEAPVYVNPAAPPDVLALPLGQGHAAYGRWAEGRGVNPIDLLAPLVDDATGALAYGATRARLVKTGRRAPLPKLEGDVPAHQLPGEESKVIKVTRG